ncbi:MAG TPA: sugar ABC transporter permease, partial [Marmoricola sp.]|nr:sugar ABC transporter permease [Marmoricola sp.]
RPAKPTSQKSDESTSQPSTLKPVSFWRRWLASDIGSLPVLLGLILIGAVFQYANHNFLTPLNLTNLLVQITAVGTIAVGIVPVLLIGEIDLSVGAVSGLCAGIMAVLSVKSGLPSALAILIAIGAGAAIGLLHGWWLAKLRVPSFVVTLAGLLGWQGALLYVLGSTGTINLNDPIVTGLANTRLPVLLGWLLGALAILLYAGVRIRQRQQKVRAGLPTHSLWLTIGYILIVAVPLAGAIALMSVNRNPNPNVPITGIPLGVLIFLAFILLFDFVTQRTRFGRYIFAVGGNAEAAHRAGINVELVRILVFVLCSTLAACGGILAASRLYAVNQSSGGGDLLLNAIAAAVIGGTSLFGGRGSTWSALLGALVIGAIANGMDLLAFASSIR